MEAGDYQSEEWQVAVREELAKAHQERDTLFRLTLELMKLMTDDQLIEARRTMDAIDQQSSPIDHQC